MYRIRTFNKISPVGLNRLDPALYAVSDSETDEDAILVRSAKLLDYDFPKNLLAISRAGAGVNNIPLDRCSEAGIVVFNTPGANANAVKELVLCAMLMGSRDVDGGIQWVRQQVASGVDVTTVVEKGKAAFIGPELYKKTLGVIGLGAIGSLVANIALSLGMDVYGYDPFLSVDAALRLDRHIHVVKDINELYKRADYITIHIHYTKDTERMIDAKAIGAMKRGVRFINLARGEIVDDDAMLAALDTGWVAAYVTDFPNNRLVGTPHVLAMPHLGASTPESEQNCAVMAVDQLREQGVTSALLNLGGNVQTVGGKPDGSPWSVGVQDPASEQVDNLLAIQVVDQAVVTSGSYQRYFQQDGQTYWHILDPETAAPARTGLASVTVVGPDGTVCDGLATALFVLGEEAGIELWRAHPELGVQVIWVREDGSVALTEGLEENYQVNPQHRGLDMTVVEA